MLYNNLIFSVENLISKLYKHIGPWVQSLGKKLKYTLKNKIRGTYNGTINRQINVQINGQINGRIM